MYLLSVKKYSSEPTNIALYLPCINDPTRLYFQTP
jgi:hypothetical protein